MDCPKCGRRMLKNTPVKAYCMKCDILIHAPSGIAYTGDPQEDKFIGAPAIRLGAEKGSLEMTLGPEALILTSQVTKEGQPFTVEKIAYAEITGVGTGRCRETDIMSAEAAITGGAVVGAAIVGPLAATSYLVHHETLKVTSTQGDYELFVPKASEWAERLRQSTTRT